MATNPPPPPERKSIDWRKVAQILRRALRLLIGDGESPLSDFRAAIGQFNLRRLLWLLLGLVILIYLASGIYVVAPGETAVVRRFGAIVEAGAVPGLHYRLPWPIDQVDIINIGQVRRETIGVTLPEDHEHPEPPGKMQALSGDTNVIDIEIIAQYQVSDPAAYLVNVRYASYRLVRDAVRAAVTSLITTQPVDNILTAERQQLQQTIRSQAQSQLDSYQSGLTIISINLQRVFPPEEVASAFTDVNSAKEDKTRAVNEANGYANSILPQARGQAEQILADANAYSSTTLGKATGAATAFGDIFTEYQNNSKIYGKEVTRYRLYLEMLDKVLKRVQIYVVDKAGGGGVNLRLFGDAPPTPAP